jgi:hypothetical protein
VPEYDIRITWQGLDRDDIDDLHDFLRSQSDVDHLYSRVQTMDAAFDPSKIVTPVTGPIFCTKWNVSVMPF